MPRAIPFQARCDLLRLNSLGYSAKDIGEQLGVSDRTVLRWLKRNDEENSVSTHYFNCGGANATSEDVKEMILLSAINDPFASARKIRRVLDLDISISSINRILAQHGLSSMHAATKTKLRDHHRTFRMDFCAFFADFDWSKAFFVDECCFSSEKGGIRFVKRPPHTRYDPKYVNYSDHCGRKLVSVWAASNFHGPSPLVPLDSRLNAETYVEILDTYGVEMIKQNFGRSQCYWVEDNCPAHRSNLVNEWFNCANALHSIDVTRIALPPYSPDINVKENSWGHLKYSLLNHNFDPLTTSELRCKVKSLWESLDSDYCQSLINSVNDRLDMILRNDGFPIKY